MKTFLFEGKAVTFKNIYLDVEDNINFTCCSKEFHYLILTSAVL